MIKPFLISTLILLFVAYCRENGVKPLPPEETLCTITDTTSHDFSWRVDTLGLFPSSLHDVAAIDPNNVWAVGEIETVGYDSVWHNKTTRNNAVKWNGSKYEYYQLEVMDEGGKPSGTKTIPYYRTIITIPGLCMPQTQNNL